MHTYIYTHIYIYIFTPHVCKFIIYFFIGNGGAQPALSSEKHLECLYKCYKISKTVWPITVS